MLLLIYVSATISNDTIESTTTLDGVKVLQRFIGDGGDGMFTFQK